VKGGFAAECRGSMPNAAFLQRWVAACAAGAILLTGVAGAGAATGARSVPFVVHWDLTPAQIASSCGAELARAKQRIDAIVHRRSARTFDTVVAALENVEADINDNLAAQQLLFQISPDAAVRAASQQCGIDVGNLLNEETARPDLYAALLAAKQSNTATGLAQHKLLELYLTGSRRSGAGLATTQRREFVSLEGQLNDLEARFGANLGNDASSITITPAQAAALPPGFAASLKKNDAGNAIVPVNESTVEAFLTNEPDADARKAFYLAYYRRGGAANVALLQSALVARARVAKLLGYPNYSAYVAADRMAGNPERIAAFLSNLDAALLPKARAERAELSTVKGSPVDNWDAGYYQNQLRKSKYSVDQDAIKQYFPAPHVVDAVLKIYSHLLGITFTPAPALPRWNPDVTAYNVTDTKTGEFRGSFYLDLFPRPGKFSHFANVGPTARRVMPDGTIRPPVNAIVGNWPAPAAGKPSLLSHGDVVTFFHEFGHNVAALLDDTPYESLSGFKLDFVEAPSQMLENFVWDPAILKEISSNVDTGAPLPDDLIKKMIAARYFGQASQTVVQDFYATVDQRFHTMPPPLDTTAVWKADYDSMTPGTFVDGTTPQGSFGHLMGGYEAGYYAYLWSKVYAQDMFSAFKTGGLENPAVGLRYRNDILAPARMLEPDVEVRNFLGRPMDPSAFYREQGLSGKP
jgi:thimet oligopeptidase